MKPLLSPVLSVHSHSRARIYAALLAESKRIWTISGLAALLPDVSVEAVRATLYLMLDDRLLDTVPHQRGLTVALTAEGRATVEQITAQWKPAEPAQDRP
ncbi:hypothetical protein HDA40_005456 [Hamadaea flava]|uniref:MarR family transcriptional regulator n=1 Tax=Hamadaea flava TaxID=1742688 RepID=A0ABV8LYY5_9ACTN|nr:hypothetical protein [Hamadaea flava]MCP2326949.1 hypothetical protein [Hamadaea flava]